MSLDTQGGVPPSPGRMNVDFEERVDFTRLRSYRLSRARAALEASDLGAVLLFDINNIRYVSATMIGEWARDKVARYALLTRTGEPIVWDFGSAARHHQLFAPWIRPENSRAGMLGLRGAVAPDAGLFAGGKRDQSDRRARRRRRDAARAGHRSSRRCSSSCRSRHRGSRRAAGDARRATHQVTGRDRVAVDGRRDGRRRVPGHRRGAQARRQGKRDRRAGHKRLYEMGSDCVEAINAISGERCTPHPHNFTDRLIRPGDQAFFDIIQSFIGYRTCYYRTFAVGRSTPAQRDAYTRAREWIDAAIELVKPGRRPIRSRGLAQGQVTSASPARWPHSACNSATGSAWACTSGRSSRGSIRWTIPIELKAGMVFAVETYCPARDGCRPRASRRRSS